MAMYEFFWQYVFQKNVSVFCLKMLLFMFHNFLLSDMIFNLKIVQLKLVEEWSNDNC
jgi:hypothetical protein